MGATEFSFSSSKHAHFHIHMCANSNPPSCPLKRHANLCTLHLSLPIFSQTCTRSLSAWLFSSRSCIINANPLHWHGTGTEAGQKRFGCKETAWMRISKALLLQVKATYECKDSTYVHQKLPKLRSDCCYERNWYSFCVSRPLGEVFLVEWSTKFTLKPNTVGGRETGKNTSLQPPKKECQTVNILVLLYLECQK